MNKVLITDGIVWIRTNDAMAISLASAGVVAPCLDPLCTASLRPDELVYHPMSDMVEVAASLEAIA